MNARERKLRALAAAVADYEGEFGRITAEEITMQHRADQLSATVLSRKESNDGQSETKS